MVVLVFVVAMKEGIHHPMPNHRDVGKETQMGKTLVTVRSTHLCVPPQHPCKDHTQKQSQQACMVSDGHFGVLANLIEMITVKQVLTV